MKRGEKIETEMGEKEKRKRRKEKKKNGTK